MAESKRIKIDERGRRIGERAPRAKLTEHEIETLRQFIAGRLTDGARPMQVYCEAAEKFELHR